MKHFRKFNVKFIFKQILSLSMAMFILIGMTSFWSFASDDKPVSKYEETHDQINFDNLMVTVVDKENLVVEVDPTISFLDKIDAKRQKSKYEKFIKDNPDDVDELLDSVNEGGNLCAMSYTDAPLEYKDGHFDRILKKPTSNSTLFTASAADTTLYTETNKPNYGGGQNFMLKTTITRYVSATAGVYTYRARTYGTWKTGISTSLNGTYRPAYGEDTVQQACPITTSSVAFASKYNYATDGSKDGQEGKNFRQSRGGDSWIEYRITDDPLGLAQLTWFRLTQKFYAKPAKAVRKINSCYNHTWASMNFNISISGSAGSSKGEQTNDVSLIVTPTVEEKSWNIYNYVSYKF